jgi:WD40 repeat protein
MKGHSNEIRCLVFSSDGRRLASSSFDHINIWDTESTANIWSLEREQSVTTVALSLEGTKIAGFDYIRADAGYEFDVATKTRSGKMIAVWDYTTGESKLRKITKTHADALVFSSTKGLLASSHHDHIQLWEVKDAIIPIAEITLGPDLQLRHVTEPYPLGFSSDGTLLAYGHSVWNIISLPPRKLSRTERPSSLLEPGGYEHSLLAYVDGWIYSAWPQGRLMPIPQHLRDQFKRWRAGKNRMVVWIQSRQPIVMDCSHLLS